MAGKNKKTKKADDRIEEAIIELYDENEPDEKKDQEKKKRRRGKKGGAGRKILLSLGVVTALLAAAYFGMAMFFNSHFMFDTQINGVDFSLKDVSEVESYLKKQVADYTLTLEESDGSR